MRPGAIRAGERFASGPALLVPDPRAKLFPTRLDLVCSHYWRNALPARGKVRDSLYMQLDIKPLSFHIFKMRSS